MMILHSTIHQNTRLNGLVLLKKKKRLKKAKKTNRNKNNTKNAFDTFVAFHNFIQQMVAYETQWDYLLNSKLDYFETIQAI